MTTREKCGRRVGRGMGRGKGVNHHMLMDDVTSLPRNIQQIVRSVPQPEQMRGSLEPPLAIQRQQVEPPPTMQIEESQDPSSAASCNEARKKARGKYKCMTVDMKTKNGKIEVDIPDDILRVVGSNARDIVNYCGHVVRNYAPLIVVKDDVLVNANWNDVVKQAGEQMWFQVKEKFTVPHCQDNRFHGFVLNTMQRLYRGWRNRLHEVYKKFKTNEERLANLPEDVQEEDWKLLVNYFGCDKFQKISKTNAANRAKLVTKHTCGTKSFAEVEELTRDPITGEKAPPDKVWLLQHTKKNQEGEIHWSDSKSKEIHEKLEDLVNQQSLESESQLTRDEILLQVLGEKSGYFRGKGAGKVAPSKRSRHQETVQEEVQKALESAKETLREELRAEVRDDVIGSLREEMRASASTQGKVELRARIEEEVRAQVQHEVDAMLQARMTVFFGSMSQQRPSTSSNGARS